MVQSRRLGRGGLQASAEQAARARRRVAHLRSLGLSQQAIADAAGVSAGSVNKVVNDPRAKLGYRVAVALASAHPAPKHLGRF